MEKTNAQRNGRNATPSTRAARKPSPARKSDGLATYARAALGIFAVTSAGLNAYANTRNSTVPIVGAVLGILITTAVILLGKIGGILFYRKRLRPSLVAAGTGVGVLALSVFHLAHAIQLLTGQHLILTFPLAVAIDIGIIVAEYSLLIAHKPGK